MAEVFRKITRITHFLSKHLPLSVLTDRLIAVYTVISQSNLFVLKCVHLPKIKCLDFKNYVSFVNTRLAKWEPLYH